MTDDVRETWTNRELPILRALAEVEEREGTLHDGWWDEVQQRLPELDATHAKRSVATLIRSGYVEGKVLGALGNPIWDVAPDYLTERGRRTTGLWPTDDMASRFVAALDEAARTAEGEDAPKVRSLAETAKSVSTGVLTGVLIKVIGGQVGE